MQTLVIVRKLGRKLWTYSCEMLKTVDTALQSLQEKGWDADFRDPLTSLTIRNNTGKKFSQFQLNTAEEHFLK